jgi:hypothetical protein
VIDALKNRGYHRLAISFFIRVRGANELARRNAHVWLEKAMMPAGLQYRSSACLNCELAHIKDADGGKAESNVFMIQFLFSQIPVAFHFKHT